MTSAYEAPKHLRDRPKRFRDAGDAPEVKVREPVVGQNRSPGLDGQLRWCVGRGGHRMVAGAAVSMDVSGPWSTLNLQLELHRARQLRTASVRQLFLPVPLFNLPGTLERFLHTAELPVERRGVSLHPPRARENKTLSVPGPARKRSARFKRANKVHGSHQGREREVHEGEKKAGVRGVVGWAVVRET